MFGRERMEENEDLGSREIWYATGAVLDELMRELGDEVSEEIEPLRAVMEAITEWAGAQERVRLLEKEVRTFRLGPDRSGARESLRAVEVWILEDSSRNTVTQELEWTDKDCELFGKKLEEVQERFVLAAEALENAADLLEYVRQQGKEEERRVEQARGIRRYLVPKKRGWNGSRSSGKAVAGEVGRLTQSGDWVGDGEVGRLREVREELCVDV